MRYGLFIIILFLIVSCAQIGLLTGGEQDVAPPSPIISQMKPAPESTNFSGSQMTIPFDEFIKLVNPNETMVVIPPNIKPRAVVKGKTLSLSWDETTLPNTTYAFYLNGTVTDATEGNDSLMVFVFSTGEVLDSLSYEVRVVNAKSGNPEKGITVGLYETFSDTTRPTYFGRTDSEGLASIQYMRPGNFEVVAFRDGNKDLKFTPGEELAFREERFNLSESIADSVPLRLFEPEAIPNVTTFRYAGPSAFILRANRSLKEGEFKLNEKLLSEEDFIFFSQDSMLIITETIDSNYYQLILSSEQLIDTVDVRVTQKEKLSAKGKINNLTGKDLMPGKKLQLFANGKIELLDPTLIRLMSVKDSAVFTPEVSVKSSMDITIPKDRTGDLMLTIYPGFCSIAGAPFTDTVDFRFTSYTAKDLGTLKVGAPAFEGQKIIQLIQNGKLVQNSPSSTDGTFTFKNLLPGSYTFQLILDENGNGQWDTGSLNEKILPEKIITFRDVQKVRANWDLDFELKPLIINGE